MAGASKASATATTWMAGSASRQLRMAPLPRPPQPIKATLILSLPAAWAERARPESVSPAAAAVVPFKKLRREVSFESLMKSSWWGGSKKVGPTCPA